MSFIRQSFYAVILLLVCGQHAAALTLQDALTAAYENSHVIRAEEAQVKVVNENAPQALSEWLPTIEGRYARGRRELEFGASEADGTTETRSLSLSQPIFNGGGTVARMRQADHQILAAEARLYAVEQDVLLETATAYLDVVRDTKLVEISRTNQNVLQKHLTASNERFRLGEVTKTDVAQAQARLALAKAELTGAEAQLAASKAAFRRVVGVQASANVILPKDAPSLPPLQLQSLIDKAEQFHPTVVALLQDQQEAEREVSVQKSNLLPTVSFNASHNEEDSVFAFASGNTESTTQTYTVDVAVPFYQSGAEYSRVRQAKHNKEVLQQNLRQQKEVIREEVIRSFHNLQSARASILSTESAVAAAEVALEGVMKEANAGARTTLDILDAEQELYNAKQELVSDQRDALVGAYQLLASVGELDVERLGLQVERKFDPEAYRKDVQYQIIGF